MANGLDGPDGEKAAVNPGERGVGAILTHRYGLSAVRSKSMRSSTGNPSR
jgi:hypothetical protein